MNTSSKPSRNYGIDALRLFAMMLVVTLHVLGLGKVLDKSGGMYYKIAWLFESFAYCSVDCYAMISGFVGYTDNPKPFKLSKYIYMWFWVFFYSFTLTFAVSIKTAVGGAAFPLKDVVSAAFPVIFNRYWYFTCYTVVFFLMPWLNRLIRNTPKKSLDKLVFVSLALLSVYSTVGLRLNYDSFITNRGYSPIWLIVLYIVGAWIKKNGVAERAKVPRTVVILVLLELVSFASRAFVRVNNITGNVLVSYVSPTEVGMAVCLIILFSKIRFSSFLQKVIAFLAPSAFGVFLFHVQSYIRMKVLPKSFLWTLKTPVWVFPFALVACILAVFVISLFVDKLRFYLFKLLHIEKLSEKIAGVIEKLFSKFLGLFGKD